MKINSRAKGKAGELELAAYLRERGFDARRGVQFKGGSDSPDVVCPALPGVHLECKRVEAGNLYTWLAQAVRDAGGKVPVVAHRRNRQDWVAILPLASLLGMLRGTT
jgi:Holliday junction resolvase